jgi:uncharacterized protein Yka (UPF0111/DUF47 family)
MKFSFLPANVEFHNYFEKASANLLDAARLLQKLLDDYEDVEELVAQINEAEHRGDFIVHEVMNLLPRTLITPIDGDDIQRLVSAVDDALDAVHAAAVRLVIYQVTEVKKPARRLARLIVESAQELDAAMKGLRDKKLCNSASCRSIPWKTTATVSSRMVCAAWWRIGRRFST